MSRRDIASFLFAIAAFPIDYLVYTLLPSVSTIAVGVVTVVMLGIAALLWITGKTEEPKPVAVLEEETEPTLSVDEIQKGRGTGRFARYEEAIASIESPSYHRFLRTRREYHRSTQLNPKLSHIEMRGFYPIYYFIPFLSKLAGKHRDLYRPPRHKLIINWDTKNAYWVGDYGMSLIIPTVRIQWVSERESIPFAHLDEWCKRYGLTYNPRSATEADLRSGGTWS